MRISFVFLVLLHSTSCDLNDVDMADTGNTGGTKELDPDLDGHDPNLVNPQQRQGYGNGDSNPTNPPSTTTRPKRLHFTTTPAPSFAEQTFLAALELGVIVGVALMVGTLFMLMVGLELLYDKACDKYRQLVKKPKPLPDIERLHPAELVGTFSRYK